MKEKYSNQYAVERYKEMVKKHYPQLKPDTIDYIYESAPPIIKDIITEVFDPKIRINNREKLCQN